MAMPEWAQRALVPVSPKSEHGQWLFGMAVSLRKRWRDMQAERWKVPDWHPSYSCGHYDSILKPADLVRKRILETALDLAWDRHYGREVKDAAQAAQKVGELNARIVDTALQLAEMFEERRNLVEAHALEDQSEWENGDPFDFWDAFEAAMQQTEFGAWAYTAQQEINAFLRIAREQSRPRPGWPDVLGRLAFRPAEPVRITDAGDVAASQSKTKSTELSGRALQLMGALDVGWQGTYPHGFLLGCLGHGQLASLVEIVFDAPADAHINEEQMRRLRDRYTRRKAQ